MNKEVLKCRLDFCILLRMSAGEGSCSFTVSWCSLPLVKSASCAVVGGQTPPERHRCSRISRWTLARTGEKMHRAAQSSSSQRAVVKVMVSYRILHVSYRILTQHSAGWISQDKVLEDTALGIPLVLRVWSLHSVNWCRESWKRAPSPPHIGDQPWWRSIWASKAHASVVSLCQGIH